MRPGSTIAAARAVGRSSAGDERAVRLCRAVGPVVRAGVGRRRGRTGDGVEVEPELQLAALRPRVVARPGPQPSGRPATRAAGT